MRRYNFDFQEAMNGLQAVETYKRAGGQFDYVLMGTRVFIPRYYFFFF